ncbi:MAG: Gfo/Idh/MocA family oxidoreductase [Akkermansiaceae bacterium]|nr:Gfo/Idh/MocA family oxidoreductase [Akkermansiaceae bacterium]
MHRRRFLRTSALGLGASILPASAYDGAFGDMRPRVGLIGAGWYGKCDLLRLVQVAPVEVVALCDVDSTMLAKAADLVATRQASRKRPRTYGDYRKMLAGHRFDIVIVGTPDHWHALPAIAAMEAGADVFVQKPISIDITEGQAMVAAAAKHKRIVQVGMQRRSTPHLIDAKERIVEGGKLGKVALVEIYCYYHMRNRRTPEEAKADVPPNLDWEMWTGPAPMRPYNGIVHPKGWRAFMEYSNGIVGDMCVHMLDLVRWMLGLGWPASVSSSGGILVDKASIATTPDTQEATFDFGEVKIIWQHRAWGSPPDPEYPWGATLYGDKGTLRASVHKWDFTPRAKGGRAEKGEAVQELEQFPEDKTEVGVEKHAAPAIRKHMKDFLSCIANRDRRPVSNIEEGYISTTSCILANLAMQTGRTLHWDAAADTIKDDADARKLMTRPYRGPWVHP